MKEQIQRDDGEWQLLLNNAFSMVESLTNRVEARDARIESLQRENEERVKAHNEIFDALQKSERENEKLSNLADQNKAFYDEARRKLAASAISPEMRERVESYLNWFDAAGWLTSAPKETSIQILRAILKKTEVADR